MSNAHKQFKASDYETADWNLADTLAYVDLWGAMDYFTKDEVRNAHQNIPAAFYAIASPLKRLEWLSNENWRIYTLVTMRRLQAAKDFILKEL